MLNRKLLEILARLGPSERKRLRNFLQSPYFNNSSQAGPLLELYDHIVAHDAAEDDPALDKALVFKRFFPDDPYQENVKNSLDSLMSKLLALVRSFLAVEQTTQPPQEMEYREMFALLRFYREQGMVERFWKVVEQVKQAQDDAPYRDAQYYFRQFSLEEEIVGLKTLTNSFQDDANIAAAASFLATYHNLQQIEMVCALLYQHQLSPLTFSSDLDARAEQALRDTATPEMLAVPLIQINRLLLLLLRDPEHPQHCAAFEQLLDDNKGKISPERYNNLRAYQRYFWSRRYVRSGDPAHKRQLFELYRAHFEEGYFYVNQQITVNALRVLITSALRMGHFDWAKAVLDTHPPERICGTRYPGEAHSLNLAEYHFYKNEYAEAQEKLTYKLFENPNFGIMADVLLIKIYFETEDDLLDSRMKALEQKVRRSKIAADTQLRYFNFLKKLDKVIKYHWQKKSSQYQKLVEELQQMPNIIERDWLLEKLGPMGEKVRR
jgi:hypothetical protein